MALLRNRRVYTAFRKGAKKARFLPPFIERVNPLLRVSPIVRRDFLLP
jgi:hypothetical protein